MSVPSRFPPNRPAPVLSTGERIRRSELRRDDLGALAQNMSLEQRTKQREDFANEWAGWLRSKMDSADCDEPSALLPDAFARLQQIIDDRIATAFKQFKTELKGVLK
jgi:hypothetical protein